MAESDGDYPRETPSKKAWTAPDLIELEFGSTGSKLNKNSVEYARSGITYNPS
jgi:hypothetical protein